MRIDRRSLFMGASAAAALGGLAVAAGAQVLPPAGYATPAGTSPFTPDVYRARRAKLMEQLKTGVAVIYGANAVDSSAPVSPPFFQNGDFAWLTGIVDEPGAILVLAPTERTVKEWLLLPSRDIENERWNQERVPLGSLIEQRTGVQRVMRTSALGGLVAALASRSKELRFLGPIASANAPVPPALELYGKVAQRVPGCALRDDTGVLPRLRCVKEPRELVLMRKAMDATRAGHLAAMRQARPGMPENELRFIVESAFRAAGGTGLAYDSIVGSGRNAASLHYATATGTVHGGELILLDAGASVGGYACDVTRTFPASGRFTPEQKVLYDLVLEAQAAAVSKLKAGAYLEDLSEAAKAVFRKAGRIDEFTHGLGHYVGLDVHDPGDTTLPIPAGSVITMEPGLYLQSANYGIRIEDLYLVTETGAERLSVGVPRTTDEIEAFMAVRT
jgi:Xaa-Pro aminopeptidase